MTETPSFLKWAGGKKQVGEHLVDLIEGDVGLGVWSLGPGQTYHEPMMGSGSMFFLLCSRGIIPTGSTSVLGDDNAALMCTMGVVANASLLPKLVQDLSELQEQYPNDLPHPNPRNQPEKKRNSRMFYRYREEFNVLSRKLRSNDTPDLNSDERGRLASLMIFLNKVCYNGLWRVNGKGDFNTPEGAYRNPGNICQEDILRRCNSHLKSAELHTRDWRAGLDCAQRGDLVYLDPPYLPIEHKGLVFDKYSSSFTFDDHKEMALRSVEAAERGVRVIISNHDLDGNETTRELYEGASRIETLDVQRWISCKGKERMRVKEILAFFDTNQNQLGSS